MLKPCVNMKINALTVSHIARSFAVTVLCLLAVLCGSAHAIAPTYMWANGKNTALFIYPSADAACKNFSGDWYAGPATNEGRDAVCYSASGSPVASVGRSPDAGCPSGSTLNTSTGQCDAPITCGGHATPELAITNSWAALQNPICTWLDEYHVNTSCTGTAKGKQTTVEYACRGGGNLGVTPDPIPSPAPPVEVDYPTCPAGTYRYTDIDNSSSCSSLVPAEVSPPPCTSGNVGTVNGQYACLPANPAPASAEAAAASAQAKAAAAKAAAGTATAVQAAKDAAIEAQRAKDASDSMPGSTAAAGSAQKAIDAAKQAAGYAGTGYSGPAGAGTGTGGGGGGGTGDTTGPKECGTPGKPKCQIDETGTPADGNSVFATAGTALDAAVTAYTGSLTQVVSEEGKDTSWGWMPAVPRGTCTPIQFASLGAIDWCASASSIEEVMSHLWGLVTAIFILAMTSSAIKGK